MNEIFVEITVNANPTELEMLGAQLNEIFDVSGIDEETDTRWKFYIAKDNYNEIACRELFDGNGLQYAINAVENKNWNAIWESDFKPVIVADFVAVRASFHAPIPNVKHEIIITPKMSFGTGHHATTYMMMKMMERYDLANKKVVDFGTGTGVLAILAAQLRAAEVTAIDYDPWSIANATENLEMNNTPEIKLLQLDHYPTDSGKADIILANINRNVIIDNFEQMRNGLISDGILILSGILTTDIPDIQEIAKKYDFLAHDKMVENNWACLAFKSLIKA